eukprot:TRINITY_DN49157_c0_g1_i1.p1 TRINITY_DN49157_c0_g1~~TRINITY_DN49157_c0_g1_i1.p1  ORF type:complete len:870 (+),score=105.28 TRINITY_DN49157_c0_g1_i1:46-2610(+)
MSDDVKLLLSQGRSKSLRQCIHNCSIPCLVFALFGGSFWQICDFPDVPSNILLDIVMVSVTLFFIFEMVAGWLWEADYRFSYFFAMDLIGTLSMIFEISFLLGPAGKIQSVQVVSEGAILRTARTSRIAARIGRLMKLSKLLAWISGKREATKAGAFFLSRMLATTLSTKLSCLTLLLVVTLPLFRIGLYPEEDLSMDVWGRLLLSKHSESQNENAVLAAVDDMAHYYSVVRYFPYKLSGSVISGGEVILGPGKIPNRLQNALRFDFSNCLLRSGQCEGGNRITLYFNFKSVEVQESVNDALMIFWVVFTMFYATCDLSATLDRLVVRPLGNMLDIVREHTDRFFRDFDNDGDDALDDGFEPAKGQIFDETVFLQQVFEKLAKIFELSMQTHVVEQDVLQTLADEEQGVLTEILGMVNTRAKKTFLERRLTPGVRHSIEDVSAEASFDKDIIDSWDFDSLSISSETRKWAVMHMLCNSAGARRSVRHIDENALSYFYDAAMAGYNDLPYHNEPHAVDVTHTVYRLLEVTDASSWLHALEISALLIAAICHDLGHRGFTNQFLIETSHESAIHYNDASPLENMHCAYLFKLCAKQDQNVFGLLSKQDYKTARKVCISAILHTDNLHHFSMVKELLKLYEIESVQCDTQATYVSSCADGLRIHPKYRDVLVKESDRFLQLFLHLADVSNPLKPFSICEAWAWRVLDEFFAQGDEEKRLGIPVGMLNDRDTTNRPGSQHGFIVFLVAPLAFATVNLFPCLHPLTTQMANNLRFWLGKWEAEVHPDVEAFAKKEQDVEKIVTKAGALHKRVLLESVLTGARRAKRTIIHGSVEGPWQTKRTSQKITMRLPQVPEAATE